MAGSGSCERFAGLETGVNVRQKRRESPFNALDLPFGHFEDFREPDASRCAAAPCEVLKLLQPLQVDEPGNLKTSQSVLRRLQRYEIR